MILTTNRVDTVYTLQQQTVSRVRHLEEPLGYEDVYGRDGGSDRLRRIEWYKLNGREEDTQKRRHKEQRTENSRVEKRR